MSIERKFRMLSTREWIQYLQYKLSPEREKELEAQAEKDSFLKEAIATIGDKENRALSHQSIVLLINEVQKYTGVSESKTIRSKEAAESISTPVNINFKWVLIILASLALIVALGYGIYYFMSQSPEENATENEMVEAESVSNIQSYADSSALPMETIPNATQAASVSADSMQNSTKKVQPKTPTTNVPRTQTTPDAITSSYGSASSTSFQKERDLFNQAQESFKQGNREEAKRILKDLKGYDNPMKEKATTILNNMETQTNGQ